MDITYVTVVAQTVLFWHPSSRVVDYAMCEAWLREHAPTPRTSNATDFQYALEYLKARCVSRQ